MDEKLDPARFAELAEVGAPAAPRRPEGVQWRAAAESDIDGMHAVAVAADRVDHPSWTTPREDIADTFDLPHIDHSRDTILALDSEGTIIAFGSSFLHPAREGELTAHLGGAVHPDHRRRGIGTATLAWRVARAQQQLAEVAPELAPGPWKASMKVHAEETNLDQQHIAERVGFAAERWFATMRRDVATAGVPAEVEVPAGYTVVPFTLDREDDARLARNDSFRDHWGSLPSSPEGWHKFVTGAVFRPDLSRLVLDDTGAVAAFCLVSVNKEDWATLGTPHAYIDLVGVVRAHRRRGLAPLVISAALAAITAADLPTALLDVDTASPTGADALYVNLGFAPGEREVALVRHL